VENKIQRRICGLREARETWQEYAMKVVATGAELRETMLEYAGLAGRRVLVPTMGALHHGHLELVKHAREAAGPAGTVVVSIFVNPIQFDQAADLDAYPRPLESDLAKCQAAGVDVVFAPEAGSIYFPDRSVTVTESLLSSGLCGAARPGHFDGVCTVVLKLFLLSGCHAAVFGEKDFQQLAIIRRMVRDLDVPVEILECPTVRESDGLAMSSRNTRLTAKQRADAPRIHRALTAAAKLHRAEEMLTAARGEIEASPLARIDYLSLVDAETLQPVSDLKRPAILATAVFYGDVRLIDHVAAGIPM
jgi:pantoate--beta-alanine ligase